MKGFDLDLRAVEEQMTASKGDEEEEPGPGPSVVLGILDGSTPPEDWIEVIGEGNVLVLEVNGDVNQLASGFARDIKEDGGRLVHFNGFLIVTPPAIDIDSDRLPG